MYQQRRNIAIISMLFVFCSVCYAYAGPTLAPPSVSAKSPSTVPDSLAFFNKPEIDPSLAADTRLDRKVTLDEVGTPLGDLLQKVSLTDFSLTCGPDCADTKLQVRLKDRSLRSVMAALAQLTPGTWKREGKGYCLYTDPKATEYGNHWWQLYGMERKRILATLRAETLKEMQQKPYIYKDGDPNPENISPEMMDMAAQAQEFWYLLPEPLQKQVADQIVDTAYYRSDHIHVSRPIEGAVVVPFQSISAQAQADALASARLLLNGNKMGNPAALSFNNIGFDVSPRIMTSDGRWYDMLAILSVHSQAIAPTLPLNHAKLPEMMRKLGDQAPETWKPLAEYQEQHVWSNDPFQVLVDPQSQPINQLPPRRPEVLNWLADKAGLEFVADYYSVAGEPLSEAAKNQKLTRPLKQELDYRAAQEDMSWKQRTDGLYLFRDNRWYRDDRLEVPDKTIKGLLKTLQAAETPQTASATAPEPSLAAQLSVTDDIVTQLTPWQIANGLLNYTIEPSREPVKGGSIPANPSAGMKIDGVPVKPGSEIRITGSKKHIFSFRLPTSTAYPFDQIADIILDDYHTYLFHSGLTPNQADPLLSGGLPVSALSPLQARQAAYLLPDLQVAFQNQPQIVLSLRPEPSFAQVQLSPRGLPPASLPLQRIRLTTSAPPDAPDADSAPP